MALPPHYTQGGQREREGERPAYRVTQARSRNAPALPARNPEVCRSNDQSGAHIHLHMRERVTAICI